MRLKIRNFRRSFVLPGLAVSAGLMSSERLSSSQPLLLSAVKSVGPSGGGALIFKHQLTRNESLGLSRPFGSGMVPELLSIQAGFSPALLADRGFGPFAGVCEGLYSLPTPNRWSKVRRNYFGLGLAGDIQHLPDFFARLGVLDIFPRFPILDRLELVRLAFPFIEPSNLKVGPALKFYPFAVVGVEVWPHWARKSESDRSRFSVPTSFQWWFGRWKGFMFSGSGTVVGACRWITDCVSGQVSSSSPKFVVIINAVYRVYSSKKWRALEASTRPLEMSLDFLTSLLPKRVEGREIGVGLLEHEPTQSTECDGRKVGSSLRDHPSDGYLNRHSSPIEADGVLEAGSGTASLDDRRARGGSEILGGGRPQSPCQVANSNPIFPIFEEAEGGEGSQEWIHQVFRLRSEFDVDFSSEHSSCDSLKGQESISKHISKYAENFVNGNESLHDFDLIHLPRLIGEIYRILLSRSLEVRWIEADLAYLQNYWAVVSSVLYPILAEGEPILHFEPDEERIQKDNPKGFSWTFSARNPPEWLVVHKVVMELIGTEIILSLLDEKGEPARLSGEFFYKPKLEGKEGSSALFQLTPFMRKNFSEENRASDLGSLILDTLELRKRASEEGSKPGELEHSTVKELRKWVSIFLKDLFWPNPSSNTELLSYQKAMFDLEEALCITQTHFEFCARQLAAVLERMGGFKDLFLWKLWSSKGIQA